MFQKLNKEKPLMTKIAELDRELFLIKAEYKVVQDDFNSKKGKVCIIFMST